MKPRAKIVLGLQFGDEGKGLVTDHLCIPEPDKTIVVRFSGGQQAGHNVVIDGVNHIHSNFGSGTLRGCPSYFTEHCTVYPTTIFRELKVLKQKGVVPTLYINPLAKITTPYDVAYARIIDMRNGRGNTCGLGIGATNRRNIETGYKLYAIDLDNPKILRAKMASICHYYSNLLTDPDEREIYYEIATTDIFDFDECVRYKPFKIKPYSFLCTESPRTFGNVFDTIVFEGSQGILLDMDHGFFPHVTFSNTTSKNALEICDKLGLTDISIYYATRCYQTRHGHGWMSNSNPVTLTNTEHEINKMNDWQLDFKTAEIDYSLINYAMDVDHLYHGSHRLINKFLVVTCLDQREGFVFDKTEINYRVNFLGSFSPESKNIKPLTYD